MNRIRLLTALATLSLAPAAFAETYQEPTPLEAHLGTGASSKSPWITTSSGALSGQHLNIKGVVSDRFGNDWWGGGYKGNYQLWDWLSGSTSQVVGGATLRVFGKLFFTEYEVARIAVGVHNWGSNVTNGSVVVMGKTIRSWFFTDQALKEVYEKATPFFNKSKSFGVGPFSVGFTAKASGHVRVEPNVSMANARATLEVKPSTQVNVSGSAGVDLWLVGAKVEGSLTPLVRAEMPATSFLQIRPNQGPCWDADVRLNVRTMNGKIEIVVNYLVDTWRKIIASWSGSTRSFTLLDLGQPCWLVLGTMSL